MSTNGDYPSDPPHEYPMGIKPAAEEITEPDLRSSRELLRSLAEVVMEMRGEFREFKDRMARMEAQIALIPKRTDQ